MSNPKNLFKHDNISHFNFKDILIEVIFATGIALIILQVVELCRKSISKVSINKFIFQNVLIVIFIGINIYSFVNKRKLAKLKEVNKNLLEINDEVRCFRHDFNNIIQAIDAYIALDDMDSLQAYFNSLVKECNYVNVIDFLNNRVMENPAISAILLNKYRFAEENNIKMNIEILIDLSKIRKKSYMISRMLGILLDNALEASIEAEEKIINVQFIKDDIKNIVLIKIENTYINKEIDLSQIYDKEFTTKPGNSGLGLWKIRDILKQDTKFDLFTTKDDHMFRQQLEIYG